MKRELKFRVWDIKYKKYFPNDWVCVDGEGEIYNNSTENCFADSENWIVEQYTGLKDMNGKEIYEGDIVKYDNGTKAEVIFKSGCFMAYNGYATSSDEAYLKLEPELLPDGYDFEVEIIGNIHENQELLNRSK